MTTPSSPPQFPPGWYADGPHLRWWDGSSWGPYAPSGPSAPFQSEEERGKAMAILSHLGFIAGGFILPLVLYLVEKGKPDRNRFVCHHACEALNFMITFMIAWIGSFVLFFVGMAVSIPTSDTASTTPPWGFFAFFPVMFGLMGLSYVFGILGMVRAGQGTWWRYPVTIRFVARGIDWRTA